jgi:Phosphorylase superfamily
MNLLIGALAMLAISAASAVEAGSVGIYMATFDPPTRARLRIVRCALGDIDLPNECQNLGKYISRLFVLVREDPNVDTLASTRERTLMVKRALKTYGARVQILPASSQEAEEKERSLLADKTIDKVYELADGDTPSKMPAAPRLGDAKLETAVFPLESDGGAAAPGDQWDPRVNQSVREVMDRLGLYRQVSADLDSLHRALFEEGWKNFLDDLKLACPFTIQRDTCDELSSGWKTISITAGAGNSQPERSIPMTNPSLVYKKGQSEDRWAEKFVNAALRQLRGTRSYAKLEDVAEDIAARTLQGYPRGKVPHLKRVVIPAIRPAQHPVKVASMPVSCSAPGGTYNMDIDQYTADRFPRAFAEFLNKDYRKHSHLPVELYVHNDTIENSYEFHARDGFDTFYFLQTRRGQLHRNIHLAVKSQPHAYRVVLTDVRGNDRRANVLCQIHRAGVFSRFHFVKSPHQEPLFTLNATGTSLKLDKNDWLLFGFRGSWRRQLQANGWHMTSLIERGLDVDLFTHPGVKQKIVTVRNVFGDDANIVLDTFYQIGARRIIYLGIAGAIQDYQVGDVVIPNEFVDRSGDSVPFASNLAQTYEKQVAKSLPVHGRTIQAWVPHLYEETISVLKNWKAQSVGAVDIEGIYLGRFARRHKDAKMAALYVISDQTLGESTIEDTNAYRGLIDESVAKIVSFLLSEVTRSP